MFWIAKMNCSPNGLTNSQYLIPTFHYFLKNQIVSTKNFNKWTKTLVPGITKIVEIAHTVAIWTFPFHQNSVKKSDDFQDLTLAQYNLKKSYFWLINMEKKCCVMKGEYNQHFLWNVYWAQCTLSQAVSGWSQLSSSSQFSD